MNPGEEAAWQSLLAMDPDDVCRRANVRFDAAEARYVVPCLGQEIGLAPARREMTGTSPEGERLLTRLGYFSRLSILTYLLHAKASPLAGHLVNPAELPVGQIFFKGSHTLPLGRLTAKYGTDPKAFAERGGTLGGKAVAYGDAAVELPVLPRVPVTLILWRGDDEFAPRASLLLDADCETQLPPDTVWSVAMLALLAML